MEHERQKREVIVCSKCSRPNGSDRAACFYCGETLPDRPRTAETPTFLAAEDWQPGFNVILREPLNELSLEFVARVCKREMSSLASHVGVGDLFPLARVAESAEASRMKQLFEASDLEVAVVSDKDLMIPKPNRRVRTIKIDGDFVSFIDFNGNSVTSYRSDEISLLVFGKLAETETSEMRKTARQDSRKQVSEERFDRDEPVIDVYTSGSKTGYRLQPTGFDFSCLGSAMRPLAIENWTGLARMLAERLPNVRIDENYSRLRNALDEVWSCEIRNASRGLTVTGLGKRSFAGSSIISNAGQFLRYSRMCQHLL